MTQRPIQPVHIVIHSTSSYCHPFNQSPNDPFNQFILSSIQPVHIIIKGGANEVDGLSEAKGGMRSSTYGAPALPNIFSTTLGKGIQHKNNEYA